MTGASVLYVLHLWRAASLSLTGVQVCQVNPAMTSSDSWVPTQYIQLPGMPGGVCSSCDLAMHATLTVHYAIHCGPVGALRPIRPRPSVPDPMVHPVGWCMQVRPILYMHTPVTARPCMRPPGPSWRPLHARVTSRERFETSRTLYSSAPCTRHHEGGRIQHLHLTLGYTGLGADCMEAWRCLHSTAAIVYVH